MSASRQARILILDDSQERINQFKTNLQGHEIWASYEAQEAIDLLDTMHFDIAFLDHDLGGIMQPSDENSGYAIACWLEQHPLRKPKVIVIHSLNPVGANNMHLALPGAYRWPCIWAQPMVLRWCVELAERKANET